MDRPIGLLGYLVGGLVWAFALEWMGAGGGWWLLFLAGMGLLALTDKAHEALAAWARRAQAIKRGERL